jgi:hypothetical protein
MILKNEPCYLEYIIPDLGQFATAFLVLVATAMMRLTLVLILDKCLHKPVPPSLMFPMWEGPVFLTQFLAICDAMSALIDTRCYWHKIIGGGIIGAIPGLFLIVAVLRLRKHQREGTIVYTLRPQPTISHVFKTFWETSGICAKLVYLWSAKTNRSIRGEWNDDNGSARRWTFFFDGFSGPGWKYAVFVMVKRTLLLIAVNCLLERPNAFCSLILQTVDTFLILVFRPFATTERVRNEVIGGCFTLLAYLNICLPILFGNELPMWPSWMGDTFTMLTATVATALAAFSSLWSAITSLVAPLLAFKDMLLGWCNFSSVDAGAAGVDNMLVATVATATVEATTGWARGHTDEKLAEKAIENIDPSASEAPGVASSSIFSDLTPEVFSSSTFWKARVTAEGAHLRAAADASKETRLAIETDTLHEEDRKEVATILMSLDIGHTSVGEEGSTARSVFSFDLSTDLAVATTRGTLKTPGFIPGGGVEKVITPLRLTPDCFEIRKIAMLSVSSILADIAMLSRLLTGNVIVEIALLSPRVDSAAEVACLPAADASASATASSVADSLLQQCADAASVLRHGKVTHAVSSIMIQDSTGRVQGFGLCRTACAEADKATEAEPILFYGRSRSGSAHPSVRQSFAPPIKLLRPSNANASEAGALSGYAAQQQQPPGYPILSRNVEMIEVNLVLNMVFEITGQAGSRQRNCFEIDLRLDLCAATGMGANDFHILNVSKSGNGTLVDLSAPENSAQEICRQSFDPSSKIFSGRVTRFLEMVSLGM